MMRNYKFTFLAAFLIFGVGGCDFGNDDIVSSRPEPQPAETFTVTVTAVDMAIKDTGEPLTIDGFPIEGGELTVE